MVSLCRPRQLTSDVLVLQIQGGKDSFITVRGSFVPTIVGLPLDVVPDLSDAIRNVSLAERKALLSDSEEWVEPEEKANDELPVVEMKSPVEHGDGKPADTPEPEAGAKAAEGVPDTKSAALDPTSAVTSDGTLDTSADTAANEVAQLALDTTVSGPRSAPTTPASATSPSAKRPRPKRGRSGITKPPREVWRLLERLMEAGAGTERLWTSEPNYPAVLSVIDVSSPHSLS